MMNAGFETSHIQIPAGEKHKTLETVSQLWSAFGSAKIERSSTIVALGGGVIGDLAGFAAASWLRGATWVVVPTSLLELNLAYLPRTGRFMSAEALAHVDL